MTNHDPSDERWMKRALALARRGEALAHPNPMVGAVLVRQGRVVGEGFHTWHGIHHAEILAIERAGQRARGSTLYVNLEPCSHSGRTGPCTEAIIAAGIRRVVAAMADPNPLVGGEGFHRLRRAGIQLTIGTEQAEARRVNEDFALWIWRHRPFVTLKAAATLDGQLALAPASALSKERWITSKHSREFVQRMRHAADAVLTGIGTVLADDPLLTDRTHLPRARPLLRVVVDSRLRLPVDSRLARTAARDVLVFTLRSLNSLAARRLNALGIDVIRVRSRDGRPDLGLVLRELGNRGILRLVTEAGATLNGEVLSRRLADRAFLFYSPRILGQSAVPLAVRGSRVTRPLAKLLSITLHRFGPDFAVEGELRNVYRYR